jgi:hypothetical protein
MRQIGLGGETGLAYHSPSVRPFLGWAVKLGQGRSHIFSHNGLGLGKTIGALAAVVAPGRRSAVRRCDLRRADSAGLRSREGRLRRRRRCDPHARRRVVGHAFAGALYPRTALVCRGWPRFTPCSAAGCAAPTPVPTVARDKVPAAVTRRLAQEVARVCESEVPDRWRWKGRAVRLVDGTTRRGIEPSIRNRARRPGEWASRSFAPSRSALWPRG